MAKVSLEEYFIERHALSPLPSLPTVAVDYINCLHHSDTWSQPVYLNQCKLDFFLQGSGYVIIENQAYPVDRGDVLLYRPHEHHFGEIPYTQNIEYFELRFEPRVLEAFAGGEALCRLYRDKSEQVLLHLEERQLQALKQRFFRLLDCLREAKPHAPVEALGYFLDILCRIYCIPENTQQTGTQDWFPKPLLAAMAYIHSQYPNRLTLQALSGAAFVSRSYLNRLFQTHLHCTPHDYLLRVRLFHACMELKNGASITETASNTGFSDPSAFAVAFKKKYGISPSQYRAGKFIEEREP